MIFVGMTRFSLYVPNSGAWLASNGTKISPEDYLAYLFSEERMEPRVEIFLNSTVPMLALAAEGHDVRHMVAYSDIMPGKYKAQLEAAAEKYPILYLDEVAVEGGTPRSIASFGKSLTEELGATGQAYGQYRLDDDDVLSADFYDQMAPYITDHHVGYVITLGRGVTVMYHEGKFYFPHEAILPMHSKGHLGVVQWDGPEFREPVGSSHNQSDRYNSVILDSRRISHLWVRSTTQDGALWQLGMDMDEQITRIENALQQLPETSQEELAEAFPLIKEKFPPGKIPRN